MADLVSFEGIRPEPVQLSHAERCRFFYYARWQAYQAMMMGVQSQRLSPNFLTERFQQEALRWLEVAREVFPLTKNGETCSIEDILNGKEPVDAEA